MPSALPRFSYFEFWDVKRNLYVSLFPTEKTRILPESKFPVNGEAVFPSVENNDVEFMHLFHSMKENDFGFFDTFWFIPKKEQTYTLSFIKNWMSSLVYVWDNCDTPYFKRYIIKSRLDDAFSKVVYVKSESLPQEAIDVIPIFRDGNKKYVALGNKKISSSVTISHGDDFHKSMLSVGKHGFVIFGEHLEQSEKEEIKEIASSFNGTPIEMKERSLSAPLRTLFEEGGFNIDKGMGKFYYIHQDSRPARDDRYWVYETEEFVFGYKRDSVSHTILVLMEGQMPEMMNDPNDTYECDKGTVLLDSDAIDVLLDSGAFFSHVFQLCIALYCPLFFDSSNYIGKTFREAMRDYDGAVRIAIADDRCMYITPTDYSETRLNVSIGNDGRINRVLGFY